MTIASGYEYDFVGPFTIHLATDSTATSFASKVPTETEPTGTGVIARGSAWTRREMQLLFYGTDAADEDFNFRAIGWSRDSTGVLWIPVQICTLAVTLGATQGPADGTVIDDDYFFADTIAVTDYNSGLADVLSPEDDTVANIILRTQGFQKLEFLYDRVGAASCNCLYREL